MKRLAIAAPSTIPGPREAGLAAAFAALVFGGFYAIADPRIAAALVGAAVAAAWAGVAYRSPRLALTLCFPLLLVAGTKFRIREADASLDGVLDAQILVELLLFGLVGLAVAAAWLGIRQRGKTTAAHRLLGVYAAIAILSTLWSAAPAMTFVRAAQLVVIAALAGLAVRVLSPFGALWLASRTLAVYVLVCSALAATFPFAVGIFNYDEESFRFAWFAVHPITAGTLAAAAALGVASAALFARGGRDSIRVSRWSPALVVALVVVLAFTNSRGPALAFAAGAGVLWLMRMRPALRAASLVAASATVLFAIVFASDVRSWLEAIAAQDSVVSRALFRNQTVDTVLEMHGRLVLWSDLKPAILAELFTGYGYQASRSVLLDTFSWAAYAHNALVQTVLDLGLPGTIALAAIVVAAWSGVWRRTLDRATRATIAALMTFLTINSIASESFAGSPAFEALLLFLLACASCHQPASTAIDSPEEAPSDPRESRPAVLDASGTAA